MTQTEVIDFERFIKKSRTDLYNSLEDCGDEQIGDFTNMIQDMINDWHSEFEEETLIENLQEEFKLYMKSLTVGGLTS